MNIKEIVNELDAAITKCNGEFIDLHLKFDTFRGKPIESKEQEDEINQVLRQIENKFQELYPALLFIANRNQYAGNVASEYQKFIESLLKAGGKFQPKETIQ